MRLRQRERRHRTRGNVTCPDGSQIQISNPMSCDALDTLMSVPKLGSDPGCCLP